MPDITISETNTDRRYTIEDEENVIRLLSIPSCLNSNGRLTPVAFSLYHNNEDYVSISRLFYSSRDECIELGKKIKVWASKGDEFAGLAELNAGKIRSFLSLMRLYRSRRLIWRIKFRIQILLCRFIWFFMNYRSRIRRYFS